MLIHDIFSQEVINQKLLLESWKINLNKFNLFLENFDFINLENYLKENWWIITKSTEIEKKEKEIKNNTVYIDWERFFNFIEFLDYYKIPSEIKYYYDIKLKPFNKWRTTPLEMLSKKYKIIWNKINSKTKSIKFMYSDYPLIWHNNWYLAYWSDSKEQTLYLFGLLRSSFWQYSLKSIVSEQWTSYQLNYNDISNFIIPNINNNLKEQLKQKLIKNWEQIIDFVKTWWSGELMYRDILEIEIDWLDEIIIWIKENYNFLNLDFKTIKRENIDDIISDKILEEINSKNDLSELEQERDLIVYCLYFWKENWEDSYINLNKINIENIFESEIIILNNKWVMWVKNSLQN